jgi:predicted metal-binding membrane protein
MSARAAPASRAVPAGAGLLLVGLGAWVAVLRGAADLEAAGALAFAGAWTLMMAAMMLPSLVPAGRAVAEVAARRDLRFGRAAPAPFAGGYLLVWVVTGLAGAGVIAAGRSAGIELGGRIATAAVLLTAAAYELTPLKEACLRRCRHPLGLVVTHWRPGPLGAARIGALSGAWCAGCCWALMVVLVALGAMSIGWMALVAALIAAEKLLPWERAATVGVAATLVALAIVQVAA